MKTSDFYFDLPEELIAQKPCTERGNDRLMLLGRENGRVEHHVMADLPSLIDDGTVMVFNNSRVRRSRCYGIRVLDDGQDGREQEFMFLNQMRPEGDAWNTMVKGAKKVKPGACYRFPDGSEGVIQEDSGNAGTEFRTICFPFRLTEDWFERNGHIPLPPYIRREDTDIDSERYQTVYAKETGSAACPTAGLHFTEDMLALLRVKGVELEWLTLHVGLGTFLPVRVEDIRDHKMHEEVYTVPYDVAERINRAKAEGRKILAVGTTSVRTLESASNEDGTVQGGTGRTSIFMYPGYRFKVVDQMFTNFHTPESTLIMLVSAFAGRENILSAYKAAVQERYRFFSYGDAMLIK
ncbi:MAG: tRNA preQ1(34) S-adenosylmethionine ribosyltransferase-isomerase QueA [Treponema sp.]|nr:tRNA preQ1(34) S-adenosylmethionine ribosyltransferase-isomerase QueA [Treponema sp.]